MASLIRLSVPPKTSGSHTAATAVAAAHTNLSGDDLIHVVNVGGKVVWSLNSVGVVATNPASPSVTASLGTYLGATFAAAFPDPSKQLLNFLEIHDGSTIVYHIDSAGVAHTP
jgi:hypothetical protein